MSENIIIAFITVFGVVLTVLVTFYNFNKNIKIEQITKERTKWREEIRCISKELISLNYSMKLPDEIIKLSKIKDSLLAELEMRLNPYDDYDTDILGYAKKDLSIKENRDMFILSISFLLKQDWERGKKEAGFSYYSDTTPRVKSVDFKKNKKQELSCKGKMCYYIYCIIGFFISLYFIVLINFNDIPEYLKMSINCAAFVTFIYVIFLSFFSRKFNIDVSITSKKQCISFFPLVVLGSYFTLYENGDTDRAIASAVMVFATSIIVEMLIPRD